MKDTSLRIMSAGSSESEKPNEDDAKQASQAGDRGNGIPGVMGRIQERTVQDPLTAPKIVAPENGFPIATHRKLSKVKLTFSLEQAMLASCESTTCYHHLEDQACQESTQRRKIHV